MDERLAKRFWKDQDPVGRRMWKPDSAEEFDQGPGPKSHFFTVVGVVGSVRMAGLTEKEPVGMYYFPFAQQVGRGMTLADAHGGRPVDDCRRHPRAGHARSIPSCLSTPSVR